MIKFYQDKFDSEALGRKVFKLYLDRSINNEKDLLSIFNQHQIDIIFCFTAFFNKNIAILEKLNFSLVSLRNTYKFSSSIVARAVKPDNRFKILQYTKDRPKIARSDILGLAKVIGSTSRYFHDINIPKNLAHHLYVKWIENSLDDKYADESFCVLLKNKLIGLATLRIKDGDGFIDLLSVNSAYQGRGLGSILVRRAVEYCKNKKVNNIFVVTEGENLAANIFYQKRGFIINKIELAYHKHFL